MCMGCSFCYSTKFLVSSWTSFWFVIVTMSRTQITSYPNSGQQWWVRNWQILVTRWLSKTFQEHRTPLSNINETYIHIYMKWLYSEMYDLEWCELILHRGRGVAANPHVDKTLYVFLMGKKPAMDQWVYWFERYFELRPWVTHEICIKLVDLPFALWHWNGIALVLISRSHKETYQCHVHEHHDMNWCCKLGIKSSLCTQESNLVLGIPTISFQ